LESFRHGIQLTCVSIYPHDDFHQAFYSFPVQAYLYSARCMVPLVLVDSPYSGHTMDCHLFFVASLGSSRQNASLRVPPTRDSSDGSDQYILGRFVLDLTRAHDCSHEVAEESESGTCHNIRYGRPVRYILISIVTIECSADYKVIERRLYLLSAVRCSSSIATKSSTKFTRTTSTSSSLPPSPQLNSCAPAYPLPSPS
jgi:hypothetical protein